MFTSVQLLVHGTYQDTFVEIVWRTDSRLLDHPSDFSTARCGIYFINRFSGIKLRFVTL